MRFSLLLLIVLSFLELKGAVVVGTNISLSESNIGWPPEARRELGNVSLRVWQDPQATDETAVWFYNDDSNLTFTNINIDEGSDWYLVEEGDRFEARAIELGSFLQVAGYDLLDTRPTFNLPLGEFYFGVTTIYDSWPEKNVFGWAKLKNTGTSLELLGSAVAYESSGLIVGTAAVIPEVSTSLLFLLGASLGLICRRRACRGCRPISSSEPRDGWYSTR